MIFFIVHMGHVHFSFLQCMAKSTAQVDPRSFFAACLKMNSSLALSFRPPELSVFGQKQDFALNHQLAILARPKKTPKRSVLVPRTVIHLIVTAKINSPIEGVREELRLITSRNLGFAYSRRGVRSAFIEVQQQLDHCLFELAPYGIRTEEEDLNSESCLASYWDNPRVELLLSSISKETECVGWSNPCSPSV